MTHYHAMSGLHGCMPDYSTVCETKKDAVESLADLFELGRDRRRELARNLSLELTNRRDGAEYCEIVECAEKDCAGDEA